MPLINWCQSTKAGSSVASPGCRRFRSRDDTSAIVTLRVALRSRVSSQATRCGYPPSLPSPTRGEAEAASRAAMVRLREAGFDNPGLEARLLADEAGGDPARLEALLGR